MMMMKIFVILMVFGFTCCGEISSAKAENAIQRWFHKLTTKERDYDAQPYLEDVKQGQIPQWEHENWYAQDWLSQKDGMSLIQGFYKADILHDQYIGKKGLPVLEVGPNFYRLSGLDKRRVVEIVDLTYGMTDSKNNGSFFLRDWNSKHMIGVFDHQGLRLH